MDGLSVRIRQSLTGRFCFCYNKGTRGQERGEPCEEEKKVECEDRKHEKKEEESYSTDDIVNPQNDLQEVKEEETAEENGSKGENTQSGGTTSNTENTNSMKSNDINFDAYEGTIKENLGKSFFRGASGEFFEYLVSGLEEVEYIMPEIKKCKWYKIRVKTLDDLYYITDYRKYSMIYYPMVNNYPYICKYGHYLFGYKLDENDNLKYMLYAVPGTKHPYDQPYGGKTGYVMWLPMEKGKEGDKDPGYWIMFYDFKDATVCVPAKKE